MKRSRLVSLTLLTPAMLAFGCGQQPPPVMRPAAVANPNAAGQPATQCDVPAQPGEPPKEPCPPGQVPGANTHRSHNAYFHRPIYRPSYVGDSSPTSSDSSTVNSSKSPSGSSHSNYGGFGSSSSRFSGGS